MPETMAAGAAVRLGVSLRTHLERVQPVLYSGSRLAVNLATAGLIPFVLRMAPPAESSLLLLVLGVAAVASNVLALGLEQILYRFPVDQVAGRLRQWLGWQMALLAVVSAASSVAVIGHLGSATVPIVAAAGVAVMADVVYRAAMASSQAAHRDRFFIAGNCFRAALEFGLGVAAVMAIPTAVAALSGLALARLAAAAVAWRGSPLAESAARPATDGVGLLARYGGNLLAWSLLLQGLEYLPQFISPAVQDTRESAGFVSAFRLFTQIALLGSSLLLLYCHPKLLACYQDHGFQRFERLWNEWFTPFAGLVTLYLLLVAAGFGLASRILLGPYAAGAEAVVWILPGAWCWAMANYAQKFVEVSLAVHYLTGLLLVGLLSYSGLLFLPRGADLPITASLGLSGAFALYTVGVAGLVLNRGLARGREARRRVWMILLVSSAVLLGACLALGASLGNG